MHNRHLVSQLALLVLFISAPSVLAGVIFPTDASVFRIAFITAEKRNAESSDIADYNDFVTNSANLNPTLQALGATWKVIGSTAGTTSVHARDNIGEDAAGSPIPIYDTQGNRVADGTADLWDGSLQNPILYSQWGGGIAGAPWTGTNTLGYGHSPGHQLGQSTPAFGRASSTGVEWVRDGTWTNTAESYLYGISSPVTNNVPEPASWALVLLVAIALACRCCTRKAGWGRRAEADT